jgi:hypothetical protein
MPIEIKELTVKITVADKPQTTDSEIRNKDSQEMIIAACVEQVLEVLSKKQER